MDGETQKRTFLGAFLRMIVLTIVLLFTICTVYEAIDQSNYTVIPHLSYNLDETWNKEV
jgi:hypothetical protein